MATAYVLPQVQVFQQFRKISQDVVGNLNACIIGPHYMLARYAESSEKALTRVTDSLGKAIGYAGVAVEVPYPLEATGVDTASVKVFFENVTAAISDLENAHVAESALFDNRISVSKGFYGAEGDTVSVALASAGSAATNGTIANGDKVYVVPYTSQNLTDGGKHVRLLTRSAITGAVSPVGDVDVGESDTSVSFTDFTVSGLTSGATAFPLLIDASWTNGSDGDYFTLRLRDRYIADFLDALKADSASGSLPSGYTGFKLLDVSVGEGEKVSVETETTAGISAIKYKVVLPAAAKLATKAMLDANVLSDPQFNKYFTVVNAASGDYSDCELAFGTCGAAYGSAIAEFRTIAKSGIEVGDVVAGDDGLSAIVKSFNYADSESKFSPIRETTSVAVGTAFGKALSEDNFTFSANAKYLGPSNTTYVLTVAALSGGKPARFNVSDKEGLDANHSVAPDANGKFTIGMWKVPTGVTPLEVSIPTSGIVAVVGQTFEIDVFAAKSSRIASANLTGISGFPSGYSTAAGVDIASSNVKLARYYGSVEVPDLLESENHRNWSASADGVRFFDGVRADFGTKDDPDVVTVLSGDIFVEHRALVTTYSGTIYEVGSTDDVQKLLGTIDMSNPLAQGCYHAILNSGEQPVFFIAVDTDDQAGYDRALERLELTGSVYSLVPMTSNDAILDDVQAHVKKMSGYEEKKWRIAFVGQSTSQVVPIYTQSLHPLNTYDNPHEYTAAVSGDVVTFDAEDETLAKGDIRAGDELRYAFENGVATKTAKIKSVIDNRRVLLAGLVDSSTSFYGKVEVWRNLDSASWTEHIATKISSFMDRRMYSIFPETLYRAGKAYPGYIGAAAIAGLVSSVPPQQGLTNITVNGFDDIPATYKNCTRTQLNNIAAHGGLIIMQDEPGGPVYVRHQVSTAAGEGNVLTTELSVVKDVDAVSYYLAKQLAPYYGKYNVSKAFLDNVETTMNKSLNYLGSYNTGDGLLGPMLLLENGETRLTGIRQDEHLKDHVIVAANLDVPLPCNVIQLYLSV